MSNKSSGNRFEQEFAEFLDWHGFWCHVLQQNKSGQPADIIAVKGDYHCLIDCKEVSTKAGFVLSRVEENQRLAMKKFAERGGHIGWFAVKFPDGDIRMISIVSVLFGEAQGIKAISKLVSEQFMTAEEWTEIVEKYGVWRENDGKRIQQGIRRSGDDCL